MNRRDFLKLLLASPLALYLNKVEAKEMNFFDNKSPEISYFGRWQDGYTGFGATYIKAHFTGKKIGAILKSPGVWWRVSIDNGEPMKFTADGAIMFSENLEDKEHEIRLVRSTEGQAGVAFFAGFFLEQGAKLIKSDRHKYALEFIGDSITAGAMNDGKYTGKNYNEVGDNDAAYGPVLARMLGAEYSVVAKSGQGVAVNYGEKPPFSLPHAADLYNWTYFSNDMNENHIEWDAKKFPIDAVFIGYGVNDFAKDNGTKPDENWFKREYKRIVRNVRLKNGNVPVISIVIPSNEMARTAAKYVSNTVKELQSLGDENIHYIEINDPKPLLKLEEYLGDITHPTKAGSKKVAEFLLPKVKKILNW